MLYVELRTPDKFRRSDLSAFISFQYNPKYVEKIKTLPARQYNPESKVWEIPASNLSELVNIFHDTDISIKGLTLKNDLTTQIKTSDLVFKTDPYQHQIDGVLHGLKYKQYLLADQQGLGKTKQAIDTAIALKNKVEKVLIICGVNSLKWNWFSEVAKHSDESAHVLGSRVRNNGRVRDGSYSERLEDLQTIDSIDSYFIITNVETFRQPPRPKKGNIVSAQHQTQLDILEKTQKLISEGIIGMVIVDEIHKVKNPDSQQGKALLKINPPYKIGMTGTPLMNSPFDLFMPLAWLGEEHGNFWMFKQHYGIFRGYGGKQCIGHKNLQELEQRLNKIQLRRLKEDVLDLPPKIRTTEYVELSTLQWKLYDEVQMALRSNLADIVISPDPLSQLIRLRQVTGSPEIISSKVKDNAKAERLEEMIEELVENGEKAIIFSNWVETLKPLIKRFERFNPAIITGEVTDRQEQVEKFQNDNSCKVILGTIGAMGTGLTLTAANTVFFMDKPWNMANVEQAEDRAHRIGTTKTVHVVSLVAKDTIDEKIECLIEKKAKLSDGIVDGNQELLIEIERQFLADALGISSID